MDPSRVSIEASISFPVLVRDWMSMSIGIICGPYMALMLAISPEKSKSSFSSIVPSRLIEPPSLLWKNDSIFVCFGEPLILIVA